MREITMSIDEQRRTMVLTRIVAGSVSMAEAVALLGLSERSVWRLKRRFLADGPAGLVHGNRADHRPVGSATRTGRGSLSWPAVGSPAPMTATSSTSSPTRAWS